MKRLLPGFVAAAMSLCAHAQEKNFWTPVSEATLAKNVFTDRYKPNVYRLFHLKENNLVTDLKTSPSERNVSPQASTFLIVLPNADGGMERYRVVEAPVMDPALAAKYPGIRSYAGQGVDNRQATVRFDVSPEGFHAMMLSPDRPTIYIDPVDPDGKHYVVFSRRDAPNYNAPFQCLTAEAGQKMQAETPASLRNADDARLRTYRLALAASGEYSSYFLDGTETTDAQRKSKVLAAMNTAMTRTNAIYERDFGIRMVLVANNDAVIYLNASS
ncbi:MAG TPA: hypothetical protein VEB42_03640, partial [Chitinophagaceae bacterium]|nr:hypothetical protein [Chitinophagaceae bacterium]